MIEALKQNNEFGSNFKELQRLLDYSPAVMYSSKANGDFGATFISENVKSQLGYEQREFLEDPGFWASNIHPDDSVRVFEELNQLFINDVHTHEYRFKHKDGTYRWMMDSLRLERDENGEPIRIVGLWVNNDKRKKNEIAQGVISDIAKKASETDVTLLDLSKYIRQELSQLLDTTNFYIAERKKHDMIVFHYLEDEYYEGNFPLVRSSGNGLSEYIIEKGETLFLNTLEVLKFQKENGMQIYGQVAKSWIGAPIVSNNSTIGIIACQSYQNEEMYDKSQCELLEFVGRQIGQFIESVQKSQEINLFRNLLNECRDCIFVIDFNKGIIIDVNERVSEVLEYNREELLNMKVQDIEGTLPDSVSWVKNANLIKSKGSILKQGLHIKKDGTSLPVELSIKYVKTGGEEYFVATARDITDRINNENEKKKIEYTNKKAIAEAEELERQRIAFDLHDGLGQKIAAANMYVSSLLSEVGTQLDENNISSFKTAARLIKEATIETRVISHNISPSSLMQLGIEHSINEMLNDYQKIHSSKLIELDSQLKNKRFSNELELALFRLVQESVNNAIRHSQAKNIKVKVLYKKKELVLTISDNGVGFDSSESSNSGLGLKSLLNRANMVGADLIIESAINQGTTITINLKV